MFISAIERINPQVNFHRKLQDSHTLCERNLPRPALHPPVHNYSNLFNEIILFSIEFISQFIYIHLYSINPQDIKSLNCTKLTFFNSIHK